MDPRENNLDSEAPEISVKPPTEVEAQKEKPQKWTLASCFQKDGCIRRNSFPMIIALAVFVGVFIGFGLRGSRQWSPRDIMFISFPGYIFLRMLKSLILPLIISSLIAAVGVLDVTASGNIGLRAIIYYFVTTIMAILLGIILVMVIRPGVGQDPAQNSSLDPTKKKFDKLFEDALMDLVRHMFPPNLVEATVISHYTVVTKTNDSNSTDKHTWKFEVVKENSTNILGLVVFSIIFGIMLSRMKEAGKPLLVLFVALSEAMMLITEWVIQFTPVGVMFLVIGKIIDIENLEKIANQLGAYFGTVMLGLFIHCTITLPIIYCVMVRKHPFTFIGNMGTALATAFASASSSATLPVTIMCLEEKNKIDPRIVRFVVPIGATINMDGTALYEAVAAIFIAQVRGISLTTGSILAISITATAASIGAAGIPEAGLVTMVMVLNAVGLPEEDLVLILMVDWLLDRFRTAVNVLGDALGTGIIAELSKRDVATPIEPELYK